MGKIYLLAIGTGLCAGAWPLLMKPANLSGGAIAAVCGLLALIGGLVLFVGKERLQIGAAPDLAVGWSWALAAGLCFAAAGLMFSVAIPDIPPEKLGAVYTALILVQIAVPVLWQLWVDLSSRQVVDLWQLAGIVLTPITAFLLLKT